MNEELQKSILKTGTSLVGIVCPDGVVMAGDKKTTAGGQIIMNKDTQKVVKINDYVVISGTGVASDIELARKLIRAELKLKELRDKKRPSISEVANLIAMMNYRNIRQPAMIPFMAGLMVGGMNEQGTAELYSIEPAGSTKKITDFDANFSSGMPFILGMLEKSYHDKLTLKEAITMAADAIRAATERDPASGYGIDIFTVTKDGIRQVSNQKGEWTYTES